MERTSVDVSDDPDELGEQERLHHGARRCFTSPTTIDRILKTAAHAKLPPFYEDNKKEDFWYEMLVDKDLTVEVGKAADAWAEDETNVQQAAKQNGRVPVATGSAMVRKFGFCRFKAVPAAESWYLLEEGPGVDEAQQTMVFVALEDLGPHNGFPSKLSRGEHICLDGKTPIWTPPTGGGLAICISLDL